VALFAGSYHGTFDEVLVKGIWKGGEPHTLPIAPGITNEQVANVVVLDYGTPEALEYIRKNARSLSAVLVEPVQSRHPALRPVEFLREVRKITQEAEAALIFDEVVTGFRTHPGGVQHLFDIRADLATYGKVAGGGMPIGILAGKSAFMDALDGGMWQYGDESCPEVGVTFFAGTFVRHPLALAATQAVLQRIKAEGPTLQERLAARTTAFVRSLNDIFEEFGVPSKVEHFASWFYFSFPADQPHASLLHYLLREKGVHIQEGFPCFLTMAHSDADLEAVLRAFRDSARELSEAGFFLRKAEAEKPAPPEELPLEVPLTEPQKEVWLAAQMSDEASCAFNESFTLRLRGPLERAALREALEKLVGRHDALRATFDAVGEKSRTAETVDVMLDDADLSSLAPAERDDAVRRLIDEDAARPFNLLTGPLFRMNLVRLAPEEHLLLFTSHHIVCDGWSTNVLLEELAALYAARREGTEAGLPAAMPFRRYALDQARWKQSPERAAVEGWWVEQFRTPVAPLELPTDRPRAAVKSFNGGTVRRTISAATVQRLKAFGAKQKCTLFATLLSGFAALIHRLTGQTDIVVGIPSAGQSQVEDASLVGHCVNFLPLRTSFEGGPDAAGLLQQVRKTVLDAYERQNYTFGSLVHKLGLKRDPSRLPLVEVQFNLEKVGSGLSFPGLKAEVDPCPKRFVNFDLFLNAVEGESGLVVDCDYNTDLFDAETVQRWLGHFEVLLESMAAEPLAPVAGLQILSEAERRRLVEEWNATQADYPRDQLVTQRIEAQAARTPQAVALICGGRQLTYAELDGQANRLANYLRRRGVKPRDRVAVCLDRSPEMLVAVLGVMKAGAAYVPLDPEFPRDRIAAVLEDASPALVLTEQDMAREEIAAESDTAPAPGVTADDVAYVIFTSGSTGKPKGVQVPHRAVVNFLCSMAKAPGLTAQDTLVAVTTLSFDIAVLELFLPLCVGGRVVIASRDDTRDGHRLLGLLRSSGATVMQATPATWRMLLEAGWAPGMRLKVLCGGEALPRDLVDALLARASWVWNMYGPTETTVWSATSRVGPGGGPVTIGPPIDNTEFYVVDGGGRPVPLGIPGELLIGGDGVALGYWKRPELTAEKFIADTFRPGPGRRLYRTGDLVRWRPDRTLEFLGRLDYQVKVRGFRIETGDVEHALKQFPGVKECVVVAREDAPGEKQLVAYYVANGTAPAAGGLRQHLSGLLPGYMVPSAFVLLSALPQTPNGKVDRKALPAPGGDSRGKEPVAPRTPTEQKLAAICAEVLKVKQVGVEDSLFDLGMDSLQVFQIVARANDAGLRLTPKQVLTGQTVAAICRDIETAGPAGERGEGPKVVAVSRDRYRVQRPRHGAEGANATGGPEP
jgi:amino acid adenylation domain-containing protein